MKYPVLDTHTREAMIIGYAATELQAHAISKAHYSVFNSSDEMAELEEMGVFLYNFRASPIQDDFDSIELDEVKDGYWDNA